MFLPLVLRYRLDLVLFVLVALAAGALCRQLVRRRRPREPLGPGVGLVLGLLIVLGGAAAEWAGEQRRLSLESMFSGLGATYAYELQQLGHAHVTASTAEDDPTFLKLIERQREWLRVNPQVADIYTFRYDGQRNVRFIVDSETDYDRDGKIRSAREERTPIGEIYAEATEEFHRALRGEPCFDSTFEPDRWGVWVASLTPIYDHEGNVEAAVGIDYPGASWLSHILGYRAVMLGGAAVLIAIMLTSATVGTLMRAEMRERKEAQDQLRRDKDAVDLVSRAKSEFISIMNHEIRSPLTALIGYASILNETPLTAAQQRYVRTIAAMADRLNHIVGDVSDLIKLEEGRLSLETLPFSPAAVINEVSDPLTARAIEKGLAFQIGQDMPAGLSLLGDAIRLRQVLTSLLNNAIKFTDRGTVTLQAHWEQEANQPAGSLTIRVADTGIGIPPDRLANLFERSSSNPGDAVRSGGRGVGLVMCHRLVELMDGRIDVASTVGHGSEFTVVLPFPLQPGATVPAMPAAPSAGIFAVGHAPAAAEILQSGLERNGYRVTVLTTGDEALQALASEPGTAVLIEVGTAEPAVLETVRRLHTAMGAKPVPIIAFATDATRDVRAACLAAGADECLTTPPYMPAVLATLTALLHPPETA